MDKIDKLLDKQLNRNNLKTTAQSAFVCHVAGELSAGSYNIISFRDGILAIKAKNNIEAFELSTKFQEIIAKINEKLGSNLVKRIMFKA